MKKYVLLMALSCCALLGWSQTMSDTQVLQYVQREMKAGTSQAQIATSLLQRGATMQQLQRIRSQYEQTGETKTIGSGTTTTSNVSTTGSRQRSNNGSVRVDAYGNNINQNKYASNSSQMQTGMYGVNGMDAGYMTGTGMYNYNMGSMLDENGMLNGRSAVYIPDTTDLTINGKTVFGRNVFNQRRLSFEPNMNIATPASYVVGPGDKVFVDVYGASQRSEELEVTPDGTIVVMNFGPIHIGGLTIQAANAKIRKTLGARYKSSEVRLTLGQSRTITVNVMGEVVAPGTYTSSAFASVFHALYMAGGVNKLGTLRDVKVFRGGRQVASVDIYDYILNGKQSSNIRLADNDVIMVGPYDCIVDVTGNVKRPMAYEMKKNESIATLIKYAGGFTGDAYKKSVRVNRTAGDKYSVYNVNEFDMNSFRVADGDSVAVGAIQPRYENMVEIVGAVFRPGRYHIGDGVTTVKTLIEQADGVTEDAFTAHAVLHRMKADRTWRVISVDVEGILNGTVADIPLENEDVLTIATQKEKANMRTITIHGEVQFPGTYEYADNETIEDFILQAGGLTDAASTARVDVARRIMDPKATADAKEIAKTFSFTLKEGLLVDGSRDFTLMPYDEVYVRRSPGYVPQRNISVEGEVLFPGTYTLAKKNLRLTDVVKAAGGVTNQAYIRGARIERPLNEDEKFRLDRLLAMAQMQASSGLDSTKVAQDSVYYVGIELDKALAHPGSDYDVVLREGDRLVVPEYNGTVKINGNVMYPNTVAYMDGKGYKWYINQAGGYGIGAKRSKAYILYQNGTVSKASKGKIEPGCEIIVPNKTRSASQNISMFASLGTSLATMVTMIATVTNLIKNF